MRTVADEQLIISRVLFRKNYFHQVLDNRIDDQ